MGYSQLIQFKRLEERTFIVHVYPTLEERHIALFAEAIKKVASAYEK